MTQKCLCSKCKFKPPLEAIGETRPKVLDDSAGSRCQHRRSRPVGIPEAPPPFLVVLGPTLVPLHPVSEGVDTWLAQALDDLDRHDPNHLASCPCLKSCIEPPSVSVLGTGEVEQRNEPPGWSRRRRSPVQASGPHLP